MNLKAPVPRMLFQHVRPAGRSYGADDDGVVHDVNPEDEAHLRTLGCVDVDPTATLTISVVPPVDEASEQEEDE